MDTPLLWVRQRCSGTEMLIDVGSFCSSEHIILYDRLDEKTGEAVLARLGGGASDVYNHRLEAIKSTKEFRT